MKDVEKLEKIQKFALRLCVKSCPCYSFVIFVHSLLAENTSTSVQCVSLVPSSRAHVIII